MEVYRSKKFNIWEYHEGNLDIHLNYDVPNVTLVPYGYARSLIFDIEKQKYYDQNRRKERNKK